ncbi:endonuclease [Pseudomonas sp. EL_65y_Pfl2_R95]|uniref:endonuclease n=1 Tax=Pseudomonas sp. EL_65y_Pfl2_R95 TaxID=3088698 RepID=UPI0030D84CC4
MPSLKILLLTALSCLACNPSWANPTGGQKQTADLKAAEQLLWKELYAGGGTTLYCDQTFSQQTGLYTVSQIYNTKQLKRALRCSTDNQCTVVNPRYPYMKADLHNLYPALTRAELVRRNAQFGDLDDSAANKLADIGCQMQATFQLVEPRDEAKGNIARAIFYMASEYDLPIIGSVQMYKQWNQMDPPDAAEQARNDKIGELQGTRNPFIDNPSLAAGISNN